MSASLKDSSNFSNECAQIDRFSKTLDASIGSIGYDVAFVPFFVLSSASSELVLNNTCSKRAFAFVYDSNASEWLDACDTRANEENRARSSIQAGARKAGSLEHPPRARERERNREKQRNELISEQTTPTKKREESTRTMMMMMKMMMMMRRKKKKKRTRNCPSPVVFHRFASSKSCLFSKDPVVVSSLLVIVFLFPFPVPKVVVGA
jgi:hypothetical protein